MENATDSITSIHQNYDAAFKEALSLYKDKTLDFLGLDLAPIAESLNVEHTEVEVKKSYADLLFKLADNTGLNLEWEATISHDDMLRFASYNVDSRRTYKMPFTTVIFTNKKPGVTYIKDKTLSFTPTVINLGERDGDKLLEEIKEKISKGESINELELIYAPLYNSSNKSVAQLLKEVMQLAPKAANDKSEYEKIIILSALLTNKFISEVDFKRVWEEIRMVLEELNLMKYAKSRYVREEKEKIAINLLEQGLGIEIIMKATGLTQEEIEELKLTI